MIDDRCIDEQKRSRGDLAHRAAKGCDSSLLGDAIIRWREKVAKRADTQVPRKRTRDDLCQTDKIIRKISTTVFTLQCKKMLPGHSSTLCWLHLGHQDPYRAIA